MWTALAIIWCVFMVVVATSAVSLTVWIRRVEGRLDRLEETTLKAADTVDPDGSGYGVRGGMY